MQIRNYGDRPPDPPDIDDLIFDEEDQRRASER